MKTIFIDCNDQLDRVFARVYRPDDPPIVVNTKPVEAAALPRLIDGYEICLDDHSYMPTELVAQCRALRHIVFLGTGASSYMDVPALADRGVTVHTIKGYGDRAVAEHTIALIFACARGLARMDRSVRAGTWGPLEGVQLEARRLAYRAWRNWQRGRPHCPRHRDAGDRLEPNATRGCTGAAGRSRRVVGAGRRRVAQPRAQRRDARHH